MFLNGNPHDGVVIPQSSGTHELEILKIPQNSCHFLSFQKECTLGLHFISKLKIDNFLTVIPFEKLGKMSPLLKLKP
jgi:hypothetical protein